MQPLYYSIMLTAMRFASMDSWTRCGLCSYRLSGQSKQVALCRNRRQRQMKVKAVIHVRTWACCAGLLETLSCAEVEHCSAQSADSPLSNWKPAQNFLKFSFLCMCAYTVIHTLLSYIFIRNHRNDIMYVLAEKPTRGGLSAGASIMVLLTMVLP